MLTIALHEGNSAALRLTVALSIVAETLSILYCFRNPLNSSPLLQKRKVQIFGAGVRFFSAGMTHLLCVSVPALCVAGRLLLLEISKLYRFCFVPNASSISDITNSASIQTLMNTTRKLPYTHSNLEEAYSPIQISSWLSMTESHMEATGAVMNITYCHFLLAIHVCSRMIS
ncbi:hypothetical protein L195_g014282 [Trifolium pratense]|uniref:Uncharacterized protein n=1 Tax=Trifolium pratense TaxID=57577 RepID=A0A2K3PQH2_TRIPR|nr:hypothetical protein L195_g014282 [Trifolium pratense]